MLNSQVKLMDAVSSSRQLLDIRGVLSDVLDNRVASFFEDVDDIGRLDDCLSLSFLFFGGSQTIQLL